MVRGGGWRGGVARAGGVGVDVHSLDEPVFRGESPTVQMGGDELPDVRFKWATNRNRRNERREVSTKVGTLWFPWWLVSHMLAITTHDGF